VAQIQVWRLDPANNGLDPDSLFSLPLVFFFRFAAFNHSKKGVEQKAKAKAKSNSKMGPSFFT
jgi:hypothetical protein